MEPPRRLHPDSARSPALQSQHWLIIVFAGHLSERLACVCSSENTARDGGHAWRLRGYWISGWRGRGIGAGAEAQAQRAEPVYMN